MQDCVIRWLREYADRYETAKFLEGDPSWFMHQVEGDGNREATAFMASCLSFGSRTQFLPRIQWLLDKASGDMEKWISSGDFEHDVPPDADRCFYRFFTFATMNALLRSYGSLMRRFGSLGGYLRECSRGGGFGAVEAICGYFASQGLSAVVPKDVHSACKRVCMFLRWMVRSGSPVDIGLWSDFIDRRTLIMPLDTHVVRQSCRLGLLKSSCASMCAAKRLTAALAEAFPDDPLRGDFALFGYGEEQARSA